MSGRFCPSRLDAEYLMIFITFELQGYYGPFFAYLFCIPFFPRGTDENGYFCEMKGAFGCAKRGSSCQGYYPALCPTHGWHGSEQLGQISGNLSWPQPIIKITNYFQCSVHALLQRSAVRFSVCEAGRECVRVKYGCNVGMGHDHQLVAQQQAGLL